MDPNSRDYLAEEFVENIIFEAGEEGDYSPSVYLNMPEEAGGSGDNDSGDNDAGEEEAGGSGEAGEVYMTRGINAILYVYV